MKGNLVRRTVTGTLFVLLVAGAILGGPLTFTLLFALAAALTAHELGRLLGRGGRADLCLTATSLAAAYLFMAAAAFCSRAADARIFLPYLLLAAGLGIAELYRRRPDPIADMACTALTQAYVALPFALLNLLAWAAPTATAVTYNPVLPLAVFAFIWLSDTGAYCTGTLAGHHHLFPRISPRKTWEGAAGGGVLAVASSLLFARSFPFLSAAEWAGLALTVAVFGTWGDLAESLLKRTLGVKDSGTILPGHGGLLDRFDSALLAVPAAVAYLYLLTLL